MFSAGQPQGRYFNPRSRKGSDAAHFEGDEYTEDISIHAPARGATSLHSAQLRDIPFQSTLPQGERPWELTMSHPLDPISIHAPARGATMDAYMTRYPIFISIHAPARGATLRNYLDDISQIISIHAPARGATEILLYSADSQKISIHAPARGATRRLLQSLSEEDNFNPRSRKGSDKYAVFLISLI